MKHNKLIANLLFTLTIISLPLAFSISATVGEANIFGVAGIIRYSWIMLLCIPVGLLALIAGLQFRKTGQHYKRLLIVAGICLPIALIFGSYRFIFRDISFDPSDISTVEERIIFDLPDNVKIATHNYGGYDVSYIKILDEDEAKRFASKIQADERWVSQLSYTIKDLLPPDIQAEITPFDFFMLYNLTSNQYNVCPNADEYRCVFIAYDCELHRMIVLDDYAGVDCSYNSEYMN